MEKYIPKSAVVAEIERLTAYFFSLHEQRIIEKILSIIDTLEVKEVDLEKEFDNYTKDILACDVQFEPFTHLYNCAKYFFELGLKTKGE